MVSTLSTIANLFRFAMIRVFSTETTVFAKFQFVRRCALILRRRIIPLLALLAGKRHNNSHLKTP
jgi:hypothetical protein